MVGASSNPPTSETSRVVLTDWAADTESIAVSPDALLYELLILSLLYDEVLVADEAFVLSQRLTSWFGSHEDFQRLRCCFGLGTIKILAHPLKAYPTAELMDQADRQPFSARSTYIEKYSSRGELPFRPSEAQRRFSQRLDLVVSDFPDLMKPIDEARFVDFRIDFARTLREILSNPIYGKWISSAFGKLSPQLIATVVSAIQDPERALQHLPGEECQAPPGDTSFTRSLAFRLSRRFRLRERRAFQHLVQSCFAAPFAASLGGIGRYGPNLRELLWIPERERFLKEDSEPIYSLEAAVTVPVRLPDVDSALIDTVRFVRESPEGVELRAATMEMGANCDFKRQEAAWRSVAELFALRANCTREFSLRLAALSIGKDVLTGAVIDGLWSAASASIPRIPGSIAGAVGASCVGLAGGHLIALMKQDLQRQKLRLDLESCVRFRCTQVDFWKEDRSEGSA